MRRVFAAPEYGLAGTLPADKRHGSAYPGQAEPQRAEMGDLAARDHQAKATGTRRL